MKKSKKNPKLKICIGLRLDENDYTELKRLAKVEKCSVRNYIHSFILLSGVNTPKVLTNRKFK